MGAFNAESMTPAAGASSPAPGRAHDALRGPEGYGRSAAKVKSEMVGELVMGRFRVLERVGSGGMGTVYRAFDERLQRQVAVKEIAGADTRILREAQAAARLNHPSIVTLYELGSEGDRTLLVSELVEGATLAELARSGQMSDRDVAGFGADVCAALAHAHARGVVHRDVKPQNVIVQVDAGAGRRAKLMDFGIASLRGAPTLTATGEVVGTLAYMAPEQAEGDPVGEPADVYSLALSLYECWAGANPVARETPAETARGIGAAVPRLGEYRPDLPPRLVACVDACLDREPDRRPTLEELRPTLENELETLDDTHSVPEGTPSTPRDEPLLALRVSQLLALCGWALAVAGISAIAGRPGLALVVGALSAPAILVASRLPWGAVPALAPLLGAVSAAPVYPAIAGLRGTVVERAVLGALGWWAMLAAASAVHVGSRLGLMSAAPHGWSRSTATAASGVLAPLIDPHALLGAGVFAMAAVLLGVVLRARHLALALLGALLWSAGLEAALRITADGRLGGVPALVAASAVAAVIVEFRRRAPRPAGRRAPIPGLGIRHLEA
jgi:eukaryotic-like serine/threonine-protein kinase